MAVENLGKGGPDGTSLGASTSEKISFYAVTPIAQRTGSAQTTITATWVTISSGFGFSTSADAASVLATIKEIQATLKLLGLWAGA